MNTPAPFDGGTFIADKSVWDRLPDAPEPIQEEWRRAVRGGQILDNAVVRLELLYSTRDIGEYEALEERLDALPRHIPVTATICVAALTALRELAAKQPKYHRVKTPDVLIAASAQEHAVGVLHCDGHYERLAEVMAFEHRWLVPRGSS